MMKNYKTMIGIKHPIKILKNKKNADIKNKYRYVLEVKKVGF